MYTEDNIGSCTPAVNRKVIKIHSSFSQFISCCPPRPVQHEHITIRPHTQQKSLHIHFERVSSGQEQRTRQERGGGRLIIFLSCTLCIVVERNAGRERVVCSKRESISLQRYKWYKIMDSTYWKLSARGKIELAALTEGCKGSRMINGGICSIKEERF
jgi:hypothetical protein